ncbi:mlkA, partial [Symbiodinium natans]
EEEELVEGNGDVIGAYDFGKYPKAEPKRCSLAGLTLVQHVPLDENVIQLESLGRLGRDLELWEGSFRNRVHKPNELRAMFPGHA